MGFRLHNEETGREVHYGLEGSSGDGISFGRRDLETMFCQGDLTAPDLAYVSRKHFTVSILPSGQYRLLDTSKNGTCVNGKMVKVSELKHGDLIRIGPEDMNNATALYFLEDGKDTDLTRRLSDKPTKECETLNNSDGDKGE